MKFEGSKYDKDKGVKEGSKADMRRDKSERKNMPAKKPEPSRMAAKRGR